MHMKSRLLSILIFLLVVYAIPVQAAVLENPLGDIEDPQALAIRILQVFLGFLATIGLVMFVYGGFVMLTSGGNAEKIKKAKATLVWAAAGVATILGSYTILQFIFNILTENPPS